MTKGRDAEPLDTGTEPKTLVCEYPPTRDEDLVLRAIHKQGLLKEWKFGY